eukprot:Platyproteum_vivax@DN3581_c0_g1_i3.p1
MHSVQAVDYITPPSSEPKTHGIAEHGWGPYQNNGGTVLAVAGPDFAVIAGDTRLSTGYRIHSRNQSKITKLTEQCMVATGGMEAEMITLHKVLRIRVSMYEHEHRKSPSVTAIAQMLSNTLYHKRFFPYYTFNVVAGVDDEGKGATYSYDAIGSYERVPYVASGTGAELVTSVLDNQIAKTNQPNASKTPLTKQGTIDLVKDVVTSAGERDIYTGDKAEVFIIDIGGIDKEILELRED